MKSGIKRIEVMGGKNSTGLLYFKMAPYRKSSVGKKTEEKESSRLKFYDENGEELTINCGKSYIAVNYADKTTFQ